MLFRYSDPEGVQLAVPANCGRPDIAGYPTDGRRLFFRCGSPEGASRILRQAGKNKMLLSGSVARKRMFCLGTVFFAGVHLEGAVA